jgi:hypothetical protein
LGCDGLQINEMYGASVNYKGYRLHADLTGISKRQLGGPFSINMFVGLPEDVEVTAATPTKDNPYFAGTPEAIITEMTVTPDLLAVGAQPAKKYRP